MLTVNNILDKFKSMSIERIYDFLTRNGVEHHCTELDKIVFRLENWSWDLYIGDDYFKMELVFPVAGDTVAEKRINKRVAEDAC